MDENVPNLGKEADIQVQEAQRVSDKMNPKRYALRHTIIEMTKVKNKDRILKATREKLHIVYKGNSKIQKPIFSRNFTSQKEGCDIVKVQKGKKKITNRNSTLQSFLLEGKTEFSRQAKANGIHH